MPDAIAGLWGVLRSLRIYYGDAGRRRAMDALYARYLKPGDLAFDIGAHVGDRTACFRRLGARVVAVEPQTACLRTLRLLYGRDPGVTIVGAAVGAREGTVALRLNPANPTVATASDDFVRAAADAAGWEDQRWTRTAQVPLTTLDALIAAHGQPAFVKLDVEGFEAEALAGLSAAVPALSFEFTTIQRAVALVCLDRLSALGPYGFDAALGETQRLVHDRRLSAREMVGWILDLPPEANSGDVYASLA